MEDFKTMLEICGLHDLGFQGLKYNGHEGMDFAKECPDRVAATIELCALYPEVEVTIEAELSSNHCPIFMALKQEGAQKLTVERVQVRSKLGM
jgi:hypothetical protein